MQDLACEFSKKFLGLISPDPHSGRGQPLRHPTPSPAFDRAQGASAPVLGPKPCSSLNFSAVVVPLVLDVVVKQFTFAISSPDELLCMLTWNIYHVSKVVGNTVLAY